MFFLVFLFLSIPQYLYPSMPHQKVSTKTPLTSFPAVKDRCSFACLYGMHNRNLASDFAIDGCKPQHISITQESIQNMPPIKIYDEYASIKNFVNELEKNFTISEAYREWSTELKNKGFKIEASEIINLLELALYAKKKNSENNTLSRNWAPMNNFINALISIKKSTFYFGDIIRINAEDMDRIMALGSFIPYAKHTLKKNFYAPTLSFRIYTLIPRAREQSSKWHQQTLSSLRECYLDRTLSSLRQESRITEETKKNILEYYKYTFENLLDNKEASGLYDSETLYNKMLTNIESAILDNDGFKIENFPLNCFSEENFKNFLIKNGYEVENNTKKYTMYVDVITKGYSNPGPENAYINDYKKVCQQSFFETEQERENVKNYLKHNFNPRDFDDSIQLITQDDNDYSFNTADLYKRKDINIHLFMNDYLKINGHYFYKINWTRFLNNKIKDDRCAGYEDMYSYTFEKVLDTILGINKDEGRSFRALLVQFYGQYCEPLS